MTNKRELTYEQLRKAFFRSCTPAGDPTRFPPTSAKVNPPEYYFEYLAKDLGLTKADTADQVLAYLSNANVFDDTELCRLKARAKALSPDNSVVTAEAKPVDTLEQLAKDLADVYTRSPDRTAYIRLVDRARKLTGKRASDIGTNKE